MPGQKIPKKENLISRKEMPGHKMPEKENTNTEFATALKKGLQKTVLERIHFWNYCGVLCLSAQLLQSFKS